MLSDKQFSEIREKTKSFYLSKCDDRLYRKNVEFPKTSAIIDVVIEVLKEYEKAINLN